MIRGRRPDDLSARLDPGSGLPAAYNGATRIRSRRSDLAEMLRRAEPLILMEAHNGLTARLAAEAEFEAVWASGLAISASLGVRDANEASWTQVLDVVEFMCDSVDVPVLVDGDTGHGNFNNVRRLVQKLCQRGAAGVCLEDKMFPKANSFVEGADQRLAPVAEFVGKIAAACDARTSAGFAVVARTEAFIAGRGLEEALQRAHSYADAGADSVLVHSKRNDAGEILSFMAAWDRDVPITIVPTTFPHEALTTFTGIGVSNFIFANQGLRTIISALRLNLARLRATQDLMSIERDIAPVSEVFRLQDLQELQHAEQRYLTEAPHAYR